MSSDAWVAVARHPPACAAERACVQEMAISHAVMPYPMTPRVRTELGGAGSSRAICLFSEARAGAAAAIWATWAMSGW